MKSTKNVPGVLTFHEQNHQCSYLVVTIVRYLRFFLFSLFISHRALSEKYTALTINLLCYAFIQVKVWCTRQEASVLNIDMKANICCVKYNPGSSNYIAVYTFMPPPTLLLTSISYSCLSLTRYTSPDLIFS